MGREIRLGSLENLPIIYKGTQELAFVYQGDRVVWANNASPVFDNVRINGGFVLDNADITIRRNTVYNFQATLTDLEVHIPYTLSLRDGDTIIDSTEIATDGGTGTVTLPQDYYTASDEAGPQDPARDLTLHVVDSEDGDDEYAFNVTDLEFDAPSVTAGQNRTGSAASYNFGTFTVTPHATSTNLTSGIVNGDSANVTVSATCGGTNSTTRQGFTTGGTATKSSAISTFIYNRTQAQSNTTCGGYGSCTASAATKCASNIVTCTDSGTRTRACVTTSTRICDNATLATQNFNQSIGCSDSNTNTGYVGDVTIAGPAEFKENVTGTYTATLPSLGGGVTVASYTWTVTGGATISGQGTNSITLSGGPRVGEISLVVSFANVAEGSTTRMSNTLDYAILDNTFSCAIANVSVSNGTTGTAVTSYSAAVGAITSISPTTYSNGSGTYVIAVTAPADFANAGTSLNCSATAIGTVVNFACSDAGYSVSDGVVGDSISASVSAGTLVSSSPSTYSLGSNTYTGTITAPAGYTNTGDNITGCTNTASAVAAPASVASCVISGAPGGGGGLRTAGAGGDCASPNGKYFTTRPQATVTFDNPVTGNAQYTATGGSISCSGSGPHWSLRYVPTVNAGTSMGSFVSGASSFTTSFFPSDSGCLNAINAGLSLSEQEYDEAAHTCSITVNFAYASGPQSTSSITCSGTLRNQG